MTDLVQRTFEGAPIRIIQIDGEPWFVLADLCAVLRLSNPTMVASRVSEDALSQAEVIDSLGRTQSARVVSEAGMYEVVIRSDSPTAKPFQRWVAHEVLPTIRRTGSYEAPALSEIEVAERWLTALKGKEAAERKVRELAPKAEYVDQFVSPGENLTFRQLASNLDVQEKKLREILLERGWIYMEEAERWSRKKQAIEVVRRYSASADKRHYFHALPQHKAPLFKNQVMHTLYVTPPGAVAINRLVKHLREGKALLEVVVA